MSSDDGTIPAIIIRIVDQGERNRIVTLLTAERGRFAAIAREHAVKAVDSAVVSIYSTEEAVVSRRGRTGLATAALRRTAALRGSAGRQVRDNQLSN